MRFGFSKRLAAVTVLVAAVTSCSVGPGSGSALSPSFFGMHLNQMTDNNGRSASPWPAAPVGAVRLWDTGTTWARLQPTPTSWDFTQLDAQVALARSHGSDVLLVLGQTPTWASRQPDQRSSYGAGSTVEPRDLTVWQNYVTTVVQRYKGRISSYEVWNEPMDKHYWTSTPEMMGRLTQVAGQAVHAADPRATVVSGAAYTVKGNSWWRRYLASGIARDVDVIGVHLYSRTPEDDVAGFDEMKQILVALKLNTKPVWNTETGFINEYQPYTLDQARGTVLRAHLLFAGAGLKRFYWYAWDNQAWVGLKLTGPDRRTLTDAGVAYQQTLRALMGVTVTSCTSSRYDTSWCDVRRGTARSRYYWAPANRKPLALPVGTTGYQHLGGRWVGARAGQVVVLNGEPIQVTLSG